MKNIVKILLCFILLIGCTSDYSIHNRLDYGDVYVDSFIQPYKVDGVDIVWVIDYSGSMYDNTEKVINGIEIMMNSLPDSGWRLNIAPIADDASIIENFPLVPGDTVEDAIDLYNIVSYSGSSMFEDGFNSLQSFIDSNNYTHTWMRQNAALLFVFVSDEDDQSLISVSDFTSWAQSERMYVYASSIIHVEPEYSLCSAASTQIGHKYMQAMDIMEGVIIDICSDDWSDGVRAATQQIRLKDSLPLTEWPIPNTIRVFIDSNEIFYWYWDEKTNAIYFDERPPEGSLVEAVYIIEGTI